MGAEDGVGGARAGGPGGRRSETPRGQRAVGRAAEHPEAAASQVWFAELPGRASRFRVPRRRDQKARKGRGSGGYYGDGAGGGGPVPRLAMYLRLRRLAG